MPPSEEEAQSRPMPCSQCGSTKGYIRRGNFRVQCRNCNSLIPNADVDMNFDKETE